MKDIQLHPSVQLAWVLVKERISIMIKQRLLSADFKASVALAAITGEKRNFGLAGGGDRSLRLAEGVD